MENTEDHNPIEDMIFKKYKLSESDIEMTKIISIRYTLRDYTRIVDDFLHYVRKSSYEKVENHSLRFIGNNTLSFYHSFRKVYSSDIESAIGEFSMSQYHLNHKIYNTDSILTYGKHKGQHITMVIFSDPGYIIYCILDHEPFILAPALLLDYKLISDSRFKYAVITNMAKLKAIEIDRDDYDDYQNDHIDDTPSYRQSLLDEYGDQAESAYWNLD